MTDENWRSAWELYRSARELSAAERDVFLNSIKEDPEVMQEVVSLLHEPEEPIPEVEHGGGMALVDFGMSRYTIVECLGRGGVGEVYSAHDGQLGRIVVLKFLRPERIGAVSAERLMREAKTLSG